MLFCAVGVLFTTYVVLHLYNKSGHKAADSKPVYGTGDKDNRVDEEPNDESVDESLSDPDKEDINKPVDEGIGKAADKSVGEPADEGINKPASGDIVGKDVNDKVVVEAPPAVERQGDKGPSSGNEKQLPADGKQPPADEKQPPANDKQQPAEEVNDSGNQEPTQSDTHGRSLDASKLAGLSNKKYGWWVREKAGHQPPVIDSTFKKLIDKYDGIFLGNAEEKVIYLTFDEGYENGYTPLILDTLKENDVKAAFFITGSYMKRNKELVRRMLDEGHIVGGHTINHPSLPSVSDSVLEKELYGFEKEYNSLFNAKIKYIRPPNGEFSERTLAATQLMGYKSVFWSLTYRDFETDKQKGADYAYKMVMDKLHNGAVILLHAVSRDNAEALDRIIKDIKAQGYEFRLLDL
ncbi:MAG TPA: delta-lactam-biosynthetic de-N-acetylase [Clostridiaceae bacterium]|nr:delta-lactam-biosynthetic de-N-acetylase [Clostridiaceae bacterium]